MDIQANIRSWNETYDWKGRGEEWSSAWGSSDMQWHFSLYPRIHSFIPTRTIMEIGPGFGRWTKYLAESCNRLILVDLSEKCISNCKKTFEACSHIEYHVNDGKMLDMISAESIDFVFSFDSLVHAEDDAIESYLNQIRSKLKNNGVAFIHHSNIGEYASYFSFVNSLMNRIPSWTIRNWLVKARLIEVDHKRGHSMTAKKFRQFAEKAGLACMSQEIINWGSGRRLIDCISMVARKDIKIKVSEKLITNRHFMDEAKHIRYLSTLYE